MSAALVALTPQYKTFTISAVPSLRWQHNATHCDPIFLYVQVLTLWLSISEGSMTLYACMACLHFSCVHWQVFKLHHYTFQIYQSNIIFNKTLA